MKTHFLLKFKLCFTYMTYSYLLKLLIEWNINRKPALGILLVGNNPASVSYIKKKQQACDAIGIKHELYHFSDDIKEYDLYNVIDYLN